MKPNQLSIRVNPVDGRIWLAHEPHLKPLRRLRDVTDDVMLALCADLSADEGSRAVERSVKFGDGMRCKITVEMVDDANE